MSQPQGQAGGSWNSSGRVKLTLGAGLGWPDIPVPWPRANCCRPQEDELQEEAAAEALAASFQYLPPLSPPWPIWPVGSLCKPKRAWHACIKSRIRQGLVHKAVREEHASALMLTESPFSARALTSSAIYPLWVTRIPLTLWPDEMPARGITSSQKIWSCTAWAGTSSAGWNNRSPESPSYPHHAMLHFLSAANFGSTLS